MTRPARLPLEQLQPYLLDVPHPRHLRPEMLPTAAEPLSWTDVFPEPGPLEIEVGFGKGTFLVESAQHRPTTNFLGIEIERKYALATAGRVARHGLTNVKIACTDARWFFKTYVREGSVRAVHVYFPDPWWKQRHKKRLLFTREFAEHVARILETGGELHFATDVHEYYVQTLDLVRTYTSLVECPRDVGEPRILTNFERKYRQEGRPIHRTLFVRNA